MIKVGKMVRQVLTSVFKKPATIMYPFEKAVAIDKFRGAIKFFPEKCTGCKLCMRDCPSDAIEIRKVGEKQFECEISFDRCIYCAQCVDSCLRKALEYTSDFELAQLDKTKLKVIYNNAKPENKIEKQT